MENREIKHEKTVYNVNVKKANKMNNELKLNVYKRQDDIKHSKEHLNEKAV